MPKTLNIMAATISGFTVNWIELRAGFCGILLNHLNTAGSGGTAPLMHTLTSCTTTAWLFYKT